MKTDNIKTACEFYKARYGDPISPELMLCIDRLNGSEHTLEEIRNTVEGEFFCEWDCDIDEWFKYYA